MVSAQSELPCDPAGNPLPEFTDASSHSLMIRDAARKTAILYDDDGPDIDAEVDVNSFVRTDEYGVKGFGAYTPHYPQIIGGESEANESRVIRSETPARYVGGVRFDGEKSVEAPYRIIRFTPTTVQENRQYKTMVSWTAWDIIWSTAPKSAASLTYHFDALINNTAPSEKVDQTNEWPDPDERPRLVHSSVCDISELCPVLSRLLGTYPDDEKRFDSAKFHKHSTD